MEDIKNVPHDVTTEFDPEVELPEVEKEPEPQRTRIERQPDGTEKEVEL